MELAIAVVLKLDELRVVDAASLFKVGRGLKAMFLENPLFGRGRVVFFPFHCRRPLFRVMARSWKWARC